MKHIGIAAVTAEGAALCYRTICAEAGKTLGEHRHPEITMHTHNFQLAFEAQARDDWDTVIKLVVDSLEKCKHAGADFGIIPANSTHFSFKDIAKLSPMPLCSILDVSVDECVAKKFRRVLTLGIGITMSRGLYTQPLKEKGIESVLPTLGEQAELIRIIYEEIMFGTISVPSEQWMIALVNRYAAAGCDAVLLGCTELPIIITAETTDVPLIDTTKLPARRAAEFACR